MAIAKGQRIDGANYTGNVIGYRAKRFKREKYRGRRLKLVDVDKSLRNRQARTSVIKSMRPFLLRRTINLDECGSKQKGFQKTMLRPTT